MTYSTTEEFIADLVFRNAISPNTAKAFLRTLSQIRAA